MSIHETLVVVLKTALGKKPLPETARIPRSREVPDTNSSRAKFKRVIIHPKKTGLAFRAALGLVLVFVVQMEAFAASKPVELKWSELSDQISGKTVELTLPGAITVKGDVATVREDGLVLDVRKTSDSKKISKGNATIPRASVTLLKVERHGSNWRVMGTVVGAIGGVALGSYVAAKTAPSLGPGIAIFVATASAASVAGNLAGGAADRNSKMIRVVE